MAILPKTLQIEAIQTIAPGVRQITFSREDGELITYKPGQFITLLLGDPQKPIRRNYSIATIPTTDESVYQTPTIEIAITCVPNGIASDYLFHARVGERVLVNGPGGRLLLREDDHPGQLVLVATGTGVTPYRAMLPQLETQLMHRSDLTVTLIFGIRSPEHVLYQTDFLQLANKYHHFQFHCCYSRQLPASVTACDHRGYAQTFLETLTLDPEQDLVYLCGNPGMIDDAYTHLKDLHFTPNTVRREKYISARATN